VTRVGTRLLATLVAAALAAVLLSACGGSDSDSSSESGSTVAGPEAKTKERAEAAKKEQEAEGKGSSQKQAGGEAGNSEGGGGGSSKESATAPLKVSGGGSGQFRAKGGDNSIQNYGEEGSESELQEVAEIVHSFYVARVEEKWEEACSYLAKSNIESLEELASQSPQLKGKGCAQILAAFTQPVSASVGRELTTVDAGSFRHDAEQGFLVYYGPEHTIYSMPMLNEGGAWQVGALSGSAIG
jgi:hypothetical protein